MAVPVDYRDPEMASIRIPLVVHRATSSDKRIGYLFTNPGGPGWSGIASLEESIKTLPFEMVEHFDIVGFDPRGVGFAEPKFACGALGEQHALLASIEVPIDTPAEILAAEAAANLCIESMGPVGGLLHSEYVARDMEEIRRALGADQISYLGSGYGSTLGVWYATLFPQSVRAMVFDSADNPDDPAGTQEERIEEALEEIIPIETQLDEALRACHDPWDCPIYNDGDPIGYFKQAAAKLELVNDAAHDPSAGLMGVITPLYAEVGWPSLWHGLYELNENDAPSILLDWALLQIDEPGAASLTRHINCLDGWALSPLDRKTLLEESEIITLVIKGYLPLLGALPIDAPDQCIFYDQFAPDPFEGPLDGGGAAILVIGNHDDAIASFGESEELATEALSNGYLVEVSHARHVVYPDNRCVNGHVHRALVNLEFPGERRVMCEKEEIPLARQVVWTNCSLNVQCTWVTVPENYQDPGAGTIEIYINMHRATSPGERIGYLFINPGGPGASGVELASVSEWFLPEEILQRFDIVGFDPRGVGGSDPEFACGGLGEQQALLASIESLVDAAEQTVAGEAAANLCIESMGPVGGLLHSEYVAKDMDEIRKFLGAEQISYLGYSYGSALGVWYASLFPQSVRALVVDGAANPFGKVETEQEQIEEEIDIVAPRENLLEKALRACIDPAECPIYNDGDPVGYFMEAVSKLELADRAPDGYPEAGFLGIISSLYDEASWPRLWRGLFELYENDDPSVLLETAAQKQNARPGEASFTAHVNCLDKWVLHPELLESLTQLEEESSATDISAPAEQADFPPYLADFPLYRAMIENSWLVADACQFYGPFAPDPIEGPMDGGDTPILVIGNLSDPITSYGESEELAIETLSNGYLVETDHSTHTVYPDNTCVNEHVHSVLIDREYPSERHVMCERQD